MYIVLYNPLSRNGGSKKSLKKLGKILNKRKLVYDVVDITKINNAANFLTTHKRATAFVIVGGDGTLNVLANNIKGFNIKQDIYLFKSGTGNDFLRSLKSKDKLVKINDYFKNLPKISFNNKERLFLNGAGVGLDGLVVYKVNNSRHKNNKFNYFRHTYEAFKKAEPLKCKINIDGTIKEYDKVWMAIGMNDKYAGGGMKMTPDANRLEDDIDLLIVKNASKFMLFLIFPIIYLGLHKYIKRYVEIIKGKDIKVEVNPSCYMQIDGEDYKNITKFHIKR